jgi:hypothetical protein
MMTQYYNSIISQTYQHNPTLSTNHKKNRYLNYGREKIKLCRIHIKRGYLLALKSDSMLLVLGWDLNHIHPDWHFLEGTKGNNKILIEDY